MNRDRWLCLPRFDSGACFAALLGGPEHGRWLIAPPSVHLLARGLQIEASSEKGERPAAVGPTP